MLSGTRGFVVVSRRRVEKMNGSREGKGPAPQSPARRVAGSGDGKFCLDQSAILSADIRSGSKFEN